MQKNSSFTLLIFLCIIIISGLLAIQFYLLANTFRLSEKNYHNEVTSAFLKVQSSKSYGAISQGYYQTLAECALELESGKINESIFKARLQQKGEIMSRRLDSLLKSETKYDPRLKGVSERIGYISIITNGAKRMVIPVQKADLSLTENKTAKNGFQTIPIGESTGSIELTSGTGQPPTTYAFEKKLQVPVFPIVIVRELLIVGGLSLLLLGSVVVVFYRVLTASRRQLKINELRTDLVNNITHELKTPLSSMAIAFKTLKLLGNGIQSPEREKLIAALQRQHHKLRQTVDRVLESAAPGEPLAIVFFDIIPVLRDYKQELISESHPLSVSIEPASYQVRGTAGVIQGVIDNLLENAQKYSSPGLPIQLIAKPDGERYRIDVVDSGKGIDPSAQKHLFSKFYRVPENNLHSVKGLGLGLYLSRQAIDRIGGEIKLSACSASGSVFTIYLLKA